MLYSRLVVALALVVSAESASAQIAKAYEQWEERAWADGKVDAAERAELHNLNERSVLEAAKDFANRKFRDDEIVLATSPDRELDPRQHPWVPMTADKANREVEPDARKARWHHAAEVDYNNDGVMEKAVLSHNGEQMAVIVYFTQPRPIGVVVYKADAIVPDVEIFGAGTRIMTSWPDLGYKILLAHKGRPSVVHIGE